MNTSNLLDFVLFLELYLVQDRSPDFERTWSFLDRRIADIETLVKTRRSVSFSYLVESLIIISPFHAGSVNAQ